MQTHKLSQVVHTYNALCRTTPMHYVSRQTNVCSADLKVSKLSINNSLQHIRSCTRCGCKNKFVKWHLDECRQTVTREAS